MAAFDAADELIGEHPEAQDQTTVDLWLEVQLEGARMSTTGATSLTRRRQFWNLRAWWSRPGGRQPGGRRST
jgi:hypothetical protein